MSSSKDPGKPHCSHTKFFIVTFFSHALLLCAVIVPLYITTNHRLVTVEDRVRLHDMELNSCCLVKETYGNFQDHEETKVTLSREKDGQTQFSNRVRRNTPYLSPDVLNSIRMETSRPRSFVKLLIRFAFVELREKEDKGRIMHSWCTWYAK